MSAKQKLWGGRFAESTSALVEKFSESVSFDARLYRQDIAGSQAHARMLGKVGVLDGGDVEKIVAGLDAILADIEGGRFEWSEKPEDDHINIEAPLTDAIGDAGTRLDSRRPSTDTVAPDHTLTLLHVQHQRL